MNDELLNHQGWLYVSIDTLKLDICKIGQTQNHLFNRTRTKTESPGYLPFVGFKIPPEKAPEIEDYIHGQIEGPRVPHRGSGRNSEWFEVLPSQAVDCIHKNMPKCIEFERDEDGFAVFRSVVWVLPLDNLFRYPDKSLVNIDQYYYIRREVNEARRILGLVRDPQADMYDYDHARRIGRSLLPPAKN